MVFKDIAELEKIVLKVSELQMFPNMGTYWLSLTTE